MHPSWAVKTAPPGPAALSWWWERGKVPARARSLMSMATGLPTQLITDRTRPLTATDGPMRLSPLGLPQLAAVPPPCSVLTGADPSAPGQPWEQTPVGGLHAEVGLKPQMSPTGHTTKEENLKSLLTAAQTMN